MTIKMTDEDYTELATIVREVAKGQPLMGQLADAMTLTRRYKLGPCWHVSAVSGGQVRAFEVQPFHYHVPHSVGPKRLMYYEDFLAMLRKHWVRPALAFLQDEQAARRARTQRFEAAEGLEFPG